MQPSPDRTRPNVSPLRRWGPIGLVMAVIAAVVAVGLIGGGDDDEAAPPDDTAPVERPEGADSWSMA